MGESKTSWKYRVALLVFVFLLLFGSVTGCSLAMNVKKVKTSQEEYGAFDLYNDKLRVTVYSDGLFTAQTADGKQILYPGDTSDLSIKIGNTAYDVQHGDLGNYTTVQPTKLNNYTAITCWEINDVNLTEKIELVGSYIKFTLIVRNDGYTTKNISLRYLFDTQLENNDGSPLMAKGVLYTYEWAFCPVDFNYWSAYTEPNVTTSQLVTYCWWDTRPTEIIFAHWPEAKGTIFYYNWSPTRRFYTPGYTSSPESDSCVLMYWDNIVLPPGATKVINVYYGISYKIPIELSIKLNKQTYRSGELMEVFAKATSNGSIVVLSRDNTNIYIDGNRVPIHSVAFDPATGYYVFYVPAPIVTGDITTYHTLKVVVAAGEGSATAETSFAVNGISLSSLDNVKLKLLGGVDSATHSLWIEKWVGRFLHNLIYYWKHPTHYNAPVYRRLKDVPTFEVIAPRSLSTGWVYSVAIYEPVRIYTNYTPPIIKHPLRGVIYRKVDELMLLPNNWIAWNWTPWRTGVWRIENLTPEPTVGIWKVELNLTNIYTGESHTLLTKNFYVIFDFNRTMGNAFVTLPHEPDYGLNNSQPYDYSLHQYYPTIWKTAIQWINGRYTMFQAVKDISELARRIWGTNTSNVMCYHHSCADESKVFTRDGYDNNFDGKVDNPVENWKYNYVAYDGRLGFYRGKATVKIDGKWYWVSSDGHYYPKHLWNLYDASKAATIAWYKDTLKMIHQNFNPEHINFHGHRHSLGVCIDYAMLGVAYLRSVGIPSRVVGIYFKNNTNGGYDGHAALQWYGWGPTQYWCGDHSGQPHNYTGWHPLDIDYITNNTKWERDKNGPYVYHDSGRVTCYAYVRTLSGDIVNVANWYNPPYKYPVINQGIHENSVYLAENENVRVYLIKTSGFESNSTANVTLKIENTLTTNITANVSVQLATIPGPDMSSIVVSENNRTVNLPADTSVNLSLSLPIGNVPQDFYELRVLVNNTTLLEKIVNVTTSYRVIAMPVTTPVNGTSFAYLVKIVNGGSALHNVTIMLDLRNSFKTNESTTYTFGYVAPNQTVSHEWTLTPVFPGDNIIEINVISDKGLVELDNVVKVKSRPKIYVSALTRVNARPGQTFQIPISVINIGDSPASDVRLTVTSPSGIYVSTPDIYVGTVDGHSMRNVTLSAFASSSINSSREYVIVTAEYSYSNVTAVIPINVLIPKVSISLEGTVSMPVSGMVYARVGEVNGLYIVVRNTGNLTLHNLVVSTSTGLRYQYYELEPGSSITIPLNYLPTTPGLSSLTVTVTSLETRNETTFGIVNVEFPLSCNVPDHVNLNSNIPVNVTVKDEVPGILFTNVTVVIELSGNGYTRTITLPLLSMNYSSVKNASTAINTTGLPSGTYTLTVRVYADGNLVATYSKSITVGMMTKTQIFQEIIREIILYARAPSSEKLRIFQET